MTTQKLKRRNFRTKTATETLKIEDNVNVYIVHGTTLKLLEPNTVCRHHRQFMILHMADDNNDNDDQQKQQNHHGDEYDFDEDCWTTGPAAPMAASLLSKDISCQGILALTLRDALLQIQQEQLLVQQQQQQKMQHLAPVSAATRAKVNSTLVGTSQEDDNDQVDDSSDSSCLIAMDDVSIQNILHAMGNAVAQTQQEQWHLQQQRQQQQQQQQQHGETPPGTSAGCSGGDGGKEEAEATYMAASTSTVQRPRLLAPAALVRGRLDHYNRNNGKWRIVMDKVTFRSRRMNLERDGGRRKRSEKPSLWHVSREQFQPPTTSVSQPPLAVANDDAAQGKDYTTDKRDSDMKKMSPVARPRGITLQILAYNDLE
jgi:hypothetical protein